VFDPVFQEKRRKYFEYMQKMTSLKKKLDNDPESVSLEELQQFKLGE
jgi:hypothetical protein